MDITDTFEHICLNHDFVLKTLRKLKKKYSNIPDLNQELDDCLLFINTAKKQGRRMEKRLRQYRAAIEALGFVRK